jgi:methylenetetrahydrofolate dehydrogenase (NADP+)/methenyltetrahydrofolate cyclohydrolase
MSLLSDYSIELKGMNAVVVGRSRIVGRPLSLLLDQAGATVTVVHSLTKDWSAFTKHADLVVMAVGRPKMLSAEHIKAGAVIVDVGINRTTDKKIVGDVDFDSVSQLAGALTPVPGGVGPMTIASLLQNTWQSFQNSTINRRE